MVVTNAGLRGAYVERGPCANDPHGTCYMPEAHC